MSGAVLPSGLDAAAVWGRSRELARAGSWSLEALAREFGVTRGEIDRALWARMGGAVVRGGAMTSARRPPPPPRSALGGFLRTIFGGRA